MNYAWLKLQSARRNITYESSCNSGNISKYRYEVIDSTNRFFILELSLDSKELILQYKYQYLIRPLTKTFNKPIVIPQRDILYACNQLYEIINQITTNKLLNNARRLEIQVNGKRWKR